MSVSFNMSLLHPQDSMYLYSPHIKQKFTEMREEKSMVTG